VKVITSENTYYAQATVLTCGPWINKLLTSLNLKIPVEVSIVFNADCIVAAKPIRCSIC